MSAVQRVACPIPDTASLQRGLVYGLSFLALAGLGLIRGENGYLWAATASLWTCLADPVGTARQRLASLGSVGLGGALACALGSVLATMPAVALAVVFVAGLAAGLAEVKGPTWALSAKLLYVVLIAACLQPVMAPAWEARMVDLGGFYLLGGIVACLICLSLVPSQRDTRPRGEVAAVFEALHDFAGALLYDTPPADTSACKRAIRSRIEAARQAIAARRSLRDPVALLYYSYAVSLADALFALLIVAGELREREPDRATLPLPHVLRSIADAREQVTQALSRHAPDLPALCTALRLELRRLHAPIVNASAPPLYQAALAALARFPTFDEWRATFRWPRPSLWHTLHGWMSAVAEHTARDARAARHAVRLALAGSLTLVPAQLWKMNHGYWIAVTVIMVLSPQLQTTWQISRKRFMGSLAGALLACAIGLAHPTPTLALAISAACLSAAYVSRLAGHPGRFALCLTPAVILFSWVGQPAADSSHFAALRGIDTAVGCLIALASYYVLAPRAELSRNYRHSMEALAVNTVYLRAAFAQAGMAAAAGADTVRLEALRVAAGRASTRAEQTLQQSGNDIAPAMGTEYARLHTTLRQMAALAGLVRAEAESSERPQPPGARTLALLDALESRLAELAIRPGTPARTEAAQALARQFRQAGGVAGRHAGRDRFLAEQAAFAGDYAGAAHASVAMLRTLTAAKGGRQANTVPQAG